MHQFSKRLASDVTSMGFAETERGFAWGHPAVLRGWRMCGLVLALPATGSISAVREKSTSIPSSGNPPSGLHKERGAAMTFGLLRLRSFILP